MSFAAAALARVPQGRICLPAQIAPREQHSKSTVLPGRETSLAKLFHATNAQTATLQSGRITLTRLRSESAAAAPSSTLPVEKAYIVILQLRASPGGELWKSGSRVPEASFLAGSVTIAHLKDEPRLQFREAFDVLLIHIPEIVFDEMAARYGARPISGFVNEAVAIDSILHDLCRALLPALDGHDHTTPLFFDHVVCAVYARLALRYGYVRPSKDASAHLLSADQLHLAKDMLAADLTEYPSLAPIAAACELSESRFVRLFRRTTGMPPFRWLRQFRVEHAKDLLLGSKLSLAQVAYECGFADQSHFTRIFAAAIGATPGEWRRVRLG